MSKKYFTVSEANELLPWVRADLLSLQEIKKKFEEKTGLLKQLRAEKKGVKHTEDNDPLFTLECELEFLQIEANVNMKSIHMKGAELKQIDLGLVDFPALMDGEEILLCWKIGEDQITHYHGTDEGYLGRKPIDGL